MKQLGYQREKAMGYAKRWAFRRNPRYLVFDKLGGDCTNFVSQCIYAGCGVMNYTPTFGWYYYNSSNRTPSWTGVQYLYNFFVNNKSVGPYAVETTRDYVNLGDIIQCSSY